MSTHIPRPPGETTPPSEPVVGGPGRVSLAISELAPWRAVLNRMLIALGVLVLAILLVYIDRGGYTDGSDGTVDLLDASYYATVTLSTTGYGDITPVSDSARLMNIFVITPLRVLFLIVLIGTTLEALTYRSREQWRITRWRRTLQDHTVVVGFGVKGRSAVQTLLTNGVPKEKIVVVDPNQPAIAEANAKGLSAILGDATRTEVLRRAEVERASKVIVSTQRDDTAVLVTLVARRLNPDAEIVVSVREAENVELVRQSGADSVVTSSDAVGRILGLATVSPALGTVLEDLIISGAGLEVGERRVLPREEGRTPRELDEVVLAVVRDEQVHSYFSPAIGHLIRGDRVVVVRAAQEQPWATRVEVGDEE